MGMFALLILPSAALAWRPAPGIPLERQLPANRQTTGSGSGSGVACDYDPWTQECNGTEIWCDSGYYTGTSGDQCWYGNYCLQLVNEWDGCPGICHTPCNWDTEDYCDMGMDENNCWMGNWCQDKSLGGCPSHTGSGSSDYSGSTSTCSEAYTQECNSTELYCDAGMDSEGCWYGNYCINQVNEWDGCHGVCSMNCNYETEDWCDMGTDANGSSPEGCWYGNYCLDSVQSWDNCPGVCYTMCNWETEETCDMGLDANGCWMGNWCQDMTMGGCPDITMVSKRGAMEKKKAMERIASGYGSDYGFGSGFNYASGSNFDYGSGSSFDFGSGSD